jgi:hypothetical protein
VTTHCHNVGAFVLGAPTAPRALVRHADLLTAYADGAMADEGETREAYLSLYVFGPEMQDHFARNRQSVAGFAGPCWARWLALDIDRADLAEALADVRRLVAAIRDRYGIDDIPVWFSGSKGFHVLIELAHNPPPSVGFNHIAKTYAMALAAAAGVVIDAGIYNVNHIIRLPNTRHAKTGLFKRRIDADVLFRLDLNGIRRDAAHPAGDGIPSLRSCPAQLADDWRGAEQATARVTEARSVVRRDAGATPDARAPRYFMDFMRFGVPQGERHRTLFRCAAWLTEKGAPPSLVSELLVEAGLDVGLTPKDVARQVECGIEHARKQRGTSAPTVDPPADPDPMPDPADVDACERWAIRHEADPLPPGATDFLFGANTTGPYGSEGGRR